MSLKRIRYSTLDGKLVSAESFDLGSHQGVRVFIDPASGSVNLVDQNSQTVAGHTTTAVNHAKMWAKQKLRDLGVPFPEERRKSKNTEALLSVASDSE